MDKLDIRNEMTQFDSKNRAFYDSLSDDEKKKFSNYLMIRWGSCVSGTADMQEYYLLSLNQRLNKHFFELHRHPKLQWLCATTVSPGLGSQRHNWISPKKKSGSDPKIRKEIDRLYPHLKDDEIELLAQITSKEELKNHLKQHGEQ